MKKYLLPFLLAFAFLPNSAIAQESQARQLVLNKLDEIQLYITTDYSDLGKAHDLIELLSNQYKSKYGVTSCNRRLDLLELSILTTNVSMIGASNVKKYEYFSKLVNEFNRTYYYCSNTSEHKKL